MLRSGKHKCAVNVLSLSLGLTSLTVFSGAILSAPFSFADDSVVDDINITVPIACTLSGTGMTSHTATINPGVYTPNIGTTTLKAYCNDNSGFAIYAAGYTGNTIGETNSNKLVGTTHTTETIPTGIATSGTSQWAMKLTTDSNATYPITIDSAPNTSGGSDATFSAYHVVPNEYVKVAHRNSSTDVGTNAIGAELTTTYAVNISSTQIADTYVGQVIYTMVHPSNETPPVEVACANKKICYNANTNIKEGTMGQQSGNANASVTLLASNFSKSGYGFAGWNTKPDYSGTFYGPNETITTPVDMSAGLPLYAVWVASSGSLQGWSGCSSLTKADEATDILHQSIRALTDQRDGQTYAIAKLADGKCWMIENLRLEADDSSDSSLARGFGGVFTGLADAEPAWASNSTMANSLYSTDGSTINIVSGGHQSYRFPRYNNINTSSRASSPTSGTNINIYSYGNYYTWSAAMANTEDLTSYSASEAANTSLCPTGWQLPYGRNSGNGSTAGGFSYLDTCLGGTGATSSSSTTPTGEVLSKAWRSYPNNFLYSGSVTDSVVYSRGSNGNYWSSTANGSTHVDFLRFLSTGVYPGTTNNFKYIGSSVRCIAL